MKNEKACSGEGTAQTMPKAGAAQAAAKTGAGRTGHVPDCPCRHKNTPRSMELQADMQKRLNRAIGQLTGVKAMIEDNRYCGDVLTQLAPPPPAGGRGGVEVVARQIRDSGGG